MITGFKIITLASALFFMACHSKSSGSAKTSLVGSWKITRATGAMPERQVGNLYEFSDTALYITEFGITYKGGLSMSDTGFVWNNLGLKKAYSYKMEGDQLVIHPIESDQQFCLDKK